MFCHQNITKTLSDSLHDQLPTALLLLVTFLAYRIELALQISNSFISHRHRIGVQFYVRSALVLDASSLDPPNTSPFNRNAPPSIPLAFAMAFVAYIS